MSGTWDLSGAPGLSALTSVPSAPYPALPLSLWFSTLPTPFFLSHLELKSRERLDRHLSGPESGETTVYGF